MTYIYILCVIIYIYIYRTTEACGEQIRSNTGSVIQNNNILNKRINYNIKFTATNIKLNRIENFRLQSYFFLFTMKN